MKTYLATLLAAVGSIGLVGCGAGSPGGPAATNKDKPSPTMSTADDTFTLSVPTLSTSIKQGEPKVVEIGIKRGKNFGQDVGLTLTGLPTGVTADPASPAIKAGQENVKITLKAAEDAALGDFTVKVAGRPVTGTDATNEFKLSVGKK